MRPRARRLAPEGSSLLDECRSSRSRVEEGAAPYQVPPQIALGGDDRRHGVERLGDHHGDIQRTGDSIEVAVRVARALTDYGPILCPGRSVTGAGRQPAVEIAARALQAGTRRTAAPDRRTTGLHGLRPELRTVQLPPSVPIDCLVTPKCAAQFYRFEHAADAFLKRRTHRFELERDHLPPQLLIGVCVRAWLRGLLLLDLARFIFAASLRLWCSRSRS